jgi:hypothetical protein
MGVTTLVVVVAGWIMWWFGLLPIGLRVLLLCGVFLLSMLTLGRLLRRTLAREAQPDAPRLSAFDRGTGTEAVTVDKRDRAEEPRLEIGFVPSRSPYLQWTVVRDREGDESAELLYRISVTNVSRSVTVDAVRAKIDMETTAFRPVPLRIMHDRPPFRTEFSLNPGETQYVDVASRWTVKGRATEGIILAYALTDIPNTIPLGHHEFKIVVSGRNVILCERKFAFEVDCKADYAGQERLPLVILPL